MKLSILIPMYNAKNYIGNCIESLLQQDLPKDDYEIVIIDDGSKDNSVEIVKNYVKDYNNIILHQESNSGAYTTRNKLLKLAKGNYIYNLDADDYIVENCLGSLLKIAESNQLDVIGFDTCETSHLNEPNLSKPIITKDVIFSSGKEFIENNSRLRHEIWWYFIKKDFLIEHQMSFNKNEYNADVVFTLEMLLKAKSVGYIPISIHRYVQTQDSLMRSKNFDITCKRIEYLQMMIINKSKLINSIKRDSNSEVLIKNMSYRRDLFTFFNILNFFKNPFSVNYIKTHIVSYKDVGAYPIKNFIGKDYNSFTYRLLNFILNKPYLIYPLASLKSLFIRPKL